MRVGPAMKFVPEQEIDDLLSTLHLEKSWLELVVESFMRMPFPRSHTRDIAMDVLQRHPHREVEAQEETVIRTINDFCAEATDFNNRKGVRLFERIDAGTYRLVRPIARHEIIDLQSQTRWEDAEEQYLWNWFEDRMRKKDSQWSELPKSQRLARFARHASDPKVQVMLARRRADFD